MTKSEGVFLSYLTLLDLASLTDSIFQERHMSSPISKLQLLLICILSFLQSNLSFNVRFSSVTYSLGTLYFVLCTRVSQ